MENNIFTRFYLGIIFLLEPVYKILAWSFWIVTNVDIFQNYNVYKNKIIEQLFKDSK